jgi:VanZ family protein
MRNKETLKRLAIFLAMLAVIAYGSLSPGEEAQKLNILDFPNSDKVIHGLMYFLLTGSFIYFLMHHFDSFTNWKVYLMVLGGPVFYGLLMEVLQYVVTADRSAELLDFVANVIGTGLAFLLARAYYRLKSTG